MNILHVKLRMFLLHRLERHIWLCLAKENKKIALTHQPPGADHELSPDHRILAPKETN
jgi:hypothetical protein